MTKMGKNNLLYNFISANLPNLFKYFKKTKFQIKKIKTNNF